MSNKCVFHHQKFELDGEEVSCAYIFDLRQVGSMSKDVAYTRNTESEVNPAHHRHRIWRQMCEEKE